MHQLRQGQQGPASVIPLVVENVLVYVLHLAAVKYARSSADTSKLEAADVFDILDDAICRRMGLSN